MKCHSFPFFFLCKPTGYTEEVQRTSGSISAILTHFEEYLPCQPTPLPRSNYISCSLVLIHRWINKLPVFLSPPPLHNHKYFFLPPFSFSLILPVSPSLTEDLSIHISDAGERNADIWSQPGWTEHWAWRVHGSSAQRQPWHLPPPSILQKPPDGGNTHFICL